MTAMAAWWCGWCLAATALGADADPVRTLSTDQQSAILEAVRPSQVRVEYDLQYDTGEAPEWYGGDDVAVSSGSYSYLNDGGELVKQKRPLESPGWLLAPTQVLVADVRIHPRFLKHIGVRVGEKLIDAQVVRLFRHQSGCLLELAAPAEGVRPLVFDAQKPGPYFAVLRSIEGPEWRAAVAALPNDLTVSDDGRSFTSAPLGALIVDSAGKPVGASLAAELATDGSWKGSPLDWPAYSATELAELHRRLEAVTSTGLLHVTLKFRSPKSSGSRFEIMWGDGDEESPTELHAFAALHTATGLLVLANLEAKQTARLEKIFVHAGSGAAVEARFGHSLRDWGCFTATVETPLAAPLALSTAPITATRNELLLTVDAEFYGDTPILRYRYTRVDGFALSYDRQVYAWLEDDEEHLFVFGPECTLIGLPMTRRNPVPDDERPWTDTGARLTPAAYILSEVDDAQKYDDGNVPLSEAEENRVAWLGVEMQNLDSDLAMVNQISKITKDGEIGAMVSFVYPDSPASAAGIQVGDILLQLHVPEHHRPLPVRMDSGSGFGFDFPWEQLGEVPEEFLSEIPQPWPAVANAFNEKLTGIGFGKPFELEYLRDSKSRRTEMNVTESPAHYDSAKRFKSEPLGLTVRDLTYEVRRFYQLAADDTGVIISKIEPGSKAYVAGLRPYEIILRVGEDPVIDAAGFGAQLAASVGEARLNVKRMTMTRVVKLNLGAPAIEATPQAEPAVDADSNGA